MLRLVDFLKADAIRLPLSLQVQAHVYIVPEVISVTESVIAATGHANDANLQSQFY